MFLRTVTALAISLMIATTAAQTASAQSTTGGELSADEIKLLFQKQKTRGLVLAPSTPATGSTTSTETASVETPIEYTQLSPEDQVNVRISFDFDSAAIRTDQKSKLDTLCEVIKSVNIPVFRIVGHTDSSGSSAYNERLSLLRAKEVKRHMVNTCGIASERLEVVGAGERFPFNPDNPEGDENRRVEFQVGS